MTLAVIPEQKTRYSFKVKPYEHQRTGVVLARKFKALGLFWEPGTGKSKAAIDFAGTLIEQRKIRAVLIVCPLSVAGVWIKQIKMNLPSKYPRRIINLAGEGSNIRDYLPMIKPRAGITDFYIINYESLWRVGKKTKARSKPEAVRNGIEPIIKHLKKYGGTVGNVRSRRGDIGYYDSSFELARARVIVEEGNIPVLIVADEVHNIKNRSANKSIAMHEFTAVSPYRLGLTGTPITNTPLDAFSEFKFINPTVYGLNWDSFRQNFAMLGGYMGQKVLSYQRLPQFTELLHQHALVIKKDECLDLPPKQYENIPVELNQKTMTVYRDMARRLVAEIEEYVEDAQARGERFQVTARIVLTKLLRLSQITSGFVTDTEGKLRRVGVEKLKVAIDLIENLVDQGESVVVFCRFRQELRDLNENLTKKKIPVRMIYGDVKQQDRTKFIEEFQESKVPMVMVCQIASGSLGITLTAARTAIFYNLDYSSANYVQAQDRIHRIGQTRKVQYLHLLASGTIDEIIYDGLQGKIEIARMVLAKPKLILERLAKKAA